MGDVVFPLVLTLWPAQRLGSLYLNPLSVEAYDASVSICGYQ